MINVKMEPVNSMDEFNALLDEAEQSSTFKIYSSIKDARKDNSITLTSYSKIATSNLGIRVYLFTKYYNGTFNSKGKIFYFRRDGAEVTEVINGGDAYRLLQIAGAANGHRIVGLNEDPRYKKAKRAIFWNTNLKEFSASPLICYDPKYDRQENYVYIYDLNSAYGAVLKDKVIDTSRFEYEREVRENEVGFLFNNDLPLIKSGSEYADIVFPLIPSPYKQFVNKYYQIKSNPEAYVGQTFNGRKLNDPVQIKSYAKQVLNYGIGAAQNHNPFFRAYIVNKCNENISQYMDQNTIMWNTDSIVSLTPRPDLPISQTDIGKFKFEYEGPLKHIGNNYQSPNNEKLAIRGLSKKLIIESRYDIFSTQSLYSLAVIPYVFDTNTNRIKRSN